MACYNSRNSVICVFSACLRILSLCKFGIHTKTQCIIEPEEELEEFIDEVLSRSHHIRYSCHACLHGIIHTRRISIQEFYHTELFHVC